MSDSIASTDTGSTEGPAKKRKPNPPPKKLSKAKKDPKGKKKIGKK